MPSRRNPFDEIERMFERMNQQFGSFGIGMSDTLGGISVDVEDAGKKYRATADLPGFAREDIEVELEDDVLRIEAESDQERDRGDDQRYIHRERTRRSVSRSIRLPETVQEDAAEATYKNGVLTVTLPKRQTTDDGGTDVPIN